MPRWTAVEIAEFVSRKRAYGGALAAVLFLVVAWWSRPPLPGLPAASGTGSDVWAVCALLLALLVATGGGLLWNRRIRALVNDEGARSHHRAAVVAGYWTVVVVALAAYFVSKWWPLSGRSAAYLIVTPGLVVPLLVFAYLEHRSMRHG